MDSNSNSEDDHDNENEENYDDPMRLKMTLQ